MNSNIMPMLRKGMPPVAMNSNIMPMLRKGMPPVAMNSDIMPMLRKGMPPGRSLFKQCPGGFTPFGRLVRGPLCWLGSGVRFRRYR
jgi:hypothetical protein